MEAQSLSGAGDGLASALVPPRPLTHPVTDLAGDAVGTPGLARREARYRRLLALADIVAATLGVLLSTHLAIGEHHLHVATILTLPLVVTAAKIVGLYDRDELLIRKTTLDEAPLILQVATLYVLAFWLSDDKLTRPQIVVLWGTLVVGTLVARCFARWLAARTSPAERILFIGSEETHDTLVRKLRDNDVHGEVVARLSVEDCARAAAFEDFSLLRQLVHGLDVHRLIIVPDDAQPEGTLDLMRAAKGLGVRVSVLPRILEVVGSAVEIDHLMGLPVLGVRRFGFSRSSRWVKRGFDIVTSAAVLVVAGPLMAALAVLVRLDSSGPVLFRQPRVGRDGKTFHILKFRTMVDGADALKADLAHRNETDGLFKIAEDPRITRVGSLLRRTSLDELPQLLNVLRGEMSVVGPRPLVLDEDCKISGWDRRRLALTPGMTGPWQILGSTRVPLGEMVKIDYLYAATWSLWGDVKILLRTVPYVLARRGM